MTQEEKQLLLKDLCARIPYGVNIQVKDWAVLDAELEIGHINRLQNDGLELKPYLRPMSSMTKEEREEVEILIFGEWFAQDSGKVDGEGWIEILANYDVSGIAPGFCGDYVDWLLEHHFDFHNLIERSLALEAPENMYKNE